MADGYERDYMPGDGEVLYRKKIKGPYWVSGLVGAIPAIGGGIASFFLAGFGKGMLALGAALGGVALGAVATACLFAFMAARIVVSRGELHVQIGMAGPKIRIDDIESFAVADSGYRARGLGARKNPDGSTIYNMLGEGEKAVRLQVRGRKAPIYFVCPEPHELVDALARAKEQGAQRIPVDTGVRLSGEEADADVVEAVVEVEAIASGEELDA